MKPMLARTIGPNFSHFPCHVQPKLNGVRALYQRGTFQSRGEKIWKDTFFPHIVDQLEHLSLGDTILDGEFYVHGWRLQRINSAVGVNNNEPNEDTPKIEYHIFDIVDPNRSFADRYAKLHEHWARTPYALPNVRVVPKAYVRNRPELEAYFRQFVAAGYEGLMARPDGPYEFGETSHGTQHRSKTLWKYKSWHDDEYVCLGVTPGEGKASIGIGALICAAHPEKAKNIQPKDLGKFIEFKVGTGFDDSERIAFMTNPPIGKLIRIRYLELSADGIPMNSSFLAVMS